MERACGKTAGLIKRSLNYISMGKFSVFILLLLVACDVFSQDSLQSFELSEVVVTGQFEPQSLKQSVYQVRTISNDRIMLRSPVNVQTVLSTELGIRFSNDLTLGTADVSLMGMGGQNVKILLDGIPLLDRGSTRESLNQVDVNTIERIEIIEGPMSVIYGTDALAGVINIITKKYEGEKISIEAKVHEETVGREYKGFGGKGVHNESVSLNWQRKSLYAAGAFTRNTFGGWKEGRSVSGNPDGDGEWHPKDQWLGQGTLGYRKDNFNIWYRLNYLNETISPLGNKVNETQTKVVDRDYITNRLNHQIQGEWEISDKWNFNGVAAYQDYSRRTLTKDYNLITGQETLSTEAGSQSKAKFNTALFRGIFVYKLSPQISIQPGVDINLSKGSGDRIDRSRSINDYAVFVSAEYKPSVRISIRPGLRFIHNSVYDAPPVIPSLNTKFSLSDAFDLRLAYAYGFRSPALRELYFYFFDSSHSIKGNPDLKAEYSNSFSGSLTWNILPTGNVKVKSTLGGFYNLFDNLISIGYDPSDPMINTYVNIYKFKTTGATLENSFNRKHLSVSVGASYIGRYNQFTEQDNSLPELLWTPEFNATASYIIGRIGNTLSLYYKYTGKRPAYAVNPGTSEIALGEIEDFNFLDVSSSQRIAKSITLTAGVKNVFNVTQLQNTSADTGGAHSTGGSVPLSYGRSYFATLSFRFNK